MKFSRNITILMLQVTLLSPMVGVNCHAQTNALPFLLDMVSYNPGEPGKAYQIEQTSSLMPPVVWRTI